MTDIDMQAIGNEMHAEMAPIKDTPIAPAHAISALALSMAIKYHDINTVQDGALYQQYKLEGKNLTPLHLDIVFETAIKMEMFLLGASERIAKVVVDAITHGETAEQPDPPEIFEFVIHASGLEPSAPDFESRFFEAGCDDATISFQDGLIVIDFAREAASLLDAVSSASDNVRAAGATIEAIHKK